MAKTTASQPKSVEIPVGRREQRKALTRSELLLAGRRLFSARGLYEASVEDVATAAGIAKGTLYQYFRNKEELIQAVVEDGFETLGTWITAQSQGSTNLSDLLGRIIEAHLDFFAENADLLRLLHQIRGLLKFDRQRWSPLRTPMQTHLDHVARLLATAPPGDRIPRTRRRTMATLLYGTVSGIGSLRAAMTPNQKLNFDAPQLTLSIVAMVLAYDENTGKSIRRRALAVRSRTRRARPTRRG